MISRFDVETERLDQNVSIGSDDRYVLENDLVVGVNKLTTTRENCSSEKK